jgi:hypothetical protein
VNVLIFVCHYKKNKQEQCEIFTGINVSQLPLTNKTEIKNLGCATPDLVISQALSSRKLVYVGKFNPAVYAKHRSCMLVLKETLFSCFLFGVTA